MLTDDREKALRLGKRNGKGGIPRLDKLRKCLSCKCVLTEHSTCIDVITVCRLTEPAVVIGSDPKVFASGPVVATFCQRCGEKVQPHVKDGLKFVFHQILEGIRQAEADDVSRETNDRMGGVE